LLTTSTTTPLHGDRYGSMPEAPASVSSSSGAITSAVITGRSASIRIVKSGNDGNRVRERVRSISGAIAFRHVGGRSNVGS
jgi:hypothetical protein